MVAAEPLDRPESVEIDHERSADAGKLPLGKRFTEFPEKLLDEQGAPVPSPNHRVVLPSFDPQDVIVREEDCSSSRGDRDPVPFIGGGRAQGGGTEGMTETIDGLCQPGRRHRLENVIESASFEGLEGPVVVCRDQHDAKVGMRRREEFHPALAWHRDVEKDDVGEEAPEKRRCFRDTCGGAYHIDLRMRR
jgi:hypothetical protein